MEKSKLNNKLDEQNQQYKEISNIIPMDAVIEIGVDCKADEIINEEMSKKIISIFDCKFVDDDNEDSKENPNNFSHWFGAIKDCGIRVPKSQVIQVPKDVERAYAMDDQENDTILVTKWVKEFVYPIIRSTITQGPHPYAFIKNGAFSNKFDATDCIIRPKDTLSTIVFKIIDLNYTSMMYGAGGTSELVVRECIPFREEKTPTIYNGLALRPEFRIFYDFDSHKVCYCENYWDYDCCHEAISANFNNKIIYETYYPEIKKRYEDFKEKAIELVSASLQDINKLKGVWSVDLLLDEVNKFWLIDMAVGKQSAYYDHEKILRALSID